MNLHELAIHEITTCHKSTPALSDDECEVYLKLLPHWSLQNHDSSPLIERSFSFRNFEDAMLFTTRIGVLAETADHHPAILTEWGKVRLSWWTHSINGLHMNDFVMAARCEEVYEFQTGNAESA